MCSLVTYMLHKSKITELSYLTQMSVTLSDEVSHLEGVQSYVERLVHSKTGPLTSHLFKRQMNVHDWKNKV